MKRWYYTGIGMILAIITGFADQNAHAQEGNEQLSVRNRDHLFGDWGGIRSRLESHGVTYDLTYTAEFFRNFDGGIEKGSDYRGDISLAGELDTEAVGWWDNGQFFMHVQHQHGNGITENEVGDFQVLSNMDADGYTQISEFWYAHNFAEEKFMLKIGKMESNADFAFVEYGGEFLNSSAGFSPTIPLVTYPDQDWGIILGYQPADCFSINFGFYQGRPDGGRSIGNTLGALYGPMLMIEPAFHYSIGEKPGHLRLGYWYKGDEVERLDESDTSGSTDGFYLTWDQLLCSEDPTDEENTQGLGVFGQIGVSDEKFFEAERYYGAGLQWTGPIPSRDDDVAGLGVFHVELSDDGGFDEDSETVFEIFYRLQVTPWFAVKPDIQYISDPGGSSNDNAFTGGVRIEMSF